MPLLGDLRKLFWRRKSVATVQGHAAQAATLGVAADDARSDNGSETRIEPPLIETMPRGPRDDDSPSSTDEIAALVRTIGEHVIRQNERTERLLNALEALPPAVASLPDHARQTGQLLQILATHARDAESRDQAMIEALGRLNQLSSQQTDVMGLLQQQLDSNAQAEARIVESIGSMPHTLREVADGGKQICELLSDISRSAELRERLFMRSIARIQYWMIAAVLLCALAAGGALVVTLIATAR